MLTIEQQKFLEANKAKRKKELRNSISINSLSPITGDVAGGESVTIYGAGFNGSELVKFGDDYATEVLTESIGVIRCKTPAHAAGLVTVSVTYGMKSATKADAFTFEEAE